MVIAEGLVARCSIRSIAADLGRSPSTVSREIRRNRDTVTGSYTPFRAHRRAIERRAQPKPSKFDQNPELRTFVQERSQPDFGASSSNVDGRTQSLPAADRGQRGPALRCRRLRN